MTMITASTALTIFIMNIHHCGPEARPIPQWARRFILDYLARICFVYEVGDNCLGPCTKRPVLEPTPLQQEEVCVHWGANWDCQEPRPGGTPPPHPKEGLGNAKQADQKEDRVNIEEGAMGGGSVGSCTGTEKGAGGVDTKESVGGRGVDCGLAGGEGGEGVGEVRRREGMSQLQGLRRDVELIASCYQDQLSTQSLVGEWRKVAKVMDRFFMWLFFIMVFLMSLLIMGKAM